MTGTWVRTADEGLQAYLLLPGQGEPRGAVVLAGEMFGVNGQLKGIAERLAGEGYAVVAPDFYWRTGQGPEFGQDEESRARAMGLMRALRREEAVADLTAARELATRHAGTGGIAALGFSLGGHLAVLAATELPFDLVVSYYGGWLLDGGLPLAEPVAPVRRSADIAANTGFLLGFFGADDFVMPLDEWQRIGEHLTAAGVAHEQVTYPGAGHGFFNEQRPEHYHAEYAADAWGRTLAALEKYVSRRS